MARPEDIDTDITLELEGSEITPDKFKRSVNAFVGLLEAITKSVCRDKPPVGWRMKVKAGSNLVGATHAEGANASHVRKILDLTAKGLAQMDLEGEVPPIYPDQALKKLRDLSGLSGRKPNDDTRVSVWVKQRRNEITPKIYTATGTALKPGFSEYGTVEGKLEVLSARGGVHFIIYERIWDKAVNCTVPDKLLKKMMESWQKKIAAHGMIQYHPDGKPKNIEADDIEIIPEDRNLPSYKDVRGILKGRL